MEIEILKLAGGLGGIGGLLAVVIIFFYKQLVAQMRIDRKFMEDRLSKVIDEYNRTTSESTKILTELYTYLRQKNGGK